MATHFAAISGFESWPEHMRRSSLLSGSSPDARQLATTLGVPAIPSPPPEVTRMEAGNVNGVRVSLLQWQLPFGPRTRAHLLTPADACGELPAVLWLQCHAGNKWLGAERLVGFGPETPSAVLDLQRRLYDGQAVANELAKAGFAVLIHDAFSWGSRKFDLSPLPEDPPVAAESSEAGQAYNEAAALHEHTIAKAAALLGTSYAGMVAYEDLTALSILKNLPEADEHRIAAGGFSGGGGRALVVSALASEVRSCVISCMMSTFGALFPEYAGTHSWLLHTPGLATHFDWPELTTIQTSTRYLVQYAEADHLFPLEGMRAADSMLRNLHSEHQERYRAGWHLGGHVFDSGFLTEAIGFLTETTFRKALS